uniref:Sushi domain-containing protein n=1 Tax=Varanus komodoensis TaxID=61221 RepID=A0A8D2KYD4_VARKO
PPPPPTPCFPVQVATSLCHGISSMLTSWIFSSLIYALTEISYLLIIGDCGAPPTLKNAVPLDKDYKDSYLPGHSVTYTCLSGFYNIQGKLDVITCLRDSQWSPLEDFCERKFYFLLYMFLAISLGMY